jgi:Ca-activated chloride channel family protein
MTRPDEPTPVLLFDEPAVDAADRPGPGALVVTRGGVEVALPLTGLRVCAVIAGPACRVEVEESFRNPYPDVIEAVYIFPLPGGAAVTDFEMVIGTRTIRGLVERRAEAERRYREARRAGRRAGLLTAERPNVFTCSVANLPPGETVRVRLRYVERLEWEADGFAFRFPLVVAPRYIPGEPVGEGVGPGVADDTDRVPDASRITPPVLLPGLRAGVALDLVVRIETGGQPVTGLAATQHAIAIALSEGAVEVRLARQDEVLDRDFVLRFRLGSDGTAPALFTARGDGDAEGYFLLAIPPPAEASPARSPRDIVFLLDRSGSMEGSKIAAARRALAIALRSLEEGDRFDIIAFETTATRLGRDGGLLPFRQETLDRADRFLERIGARGGTEVLGPLVQALGGPREAGRLLIVMLITDGQVGNEPEVLAAAARHLAGARLFTVGIDTAVNEAFLRRLAALGRGACLLLAPSEDLDVAIPRFAAGFGAPLVTDLAIEAAGIRPVPGSQVPPQVPDVFEGQPAVIMGRYTGAGLARARGRGGAQSLTWDVMPQETGADILAPLWATAKIQDLEDQLRLELERDRGPLEAEIERLALAHRQVSSRTAFVVVDEHEVVDPDGTIRRVVQPVQFPMGWRWEGVFGERVMALRRATMPFPSAADSASLASGEFDPRVESAAVAMQWVTKAAMPHSPMFRLRERTASPDVELAATQRANGSWEDNVLATAQTAIALMLLGHTTRRGAYRAAVTKALRWLQTQTGQLQDGSPEQVWTAIAFRLAGHLTRAGQWDRASQNLLSRAASAPGPLGSVVQALAAGSDPATLEHALTTSLDGTSPADGILKDHLDRLCAAMLPQSP